MTQKPLFALALLLIGALALSLIPQPAYARELPSLLGLDPQILKNVDQAVKRNAEMADQRAREVQRAIEDRSKNLSRNDENKGRGNSNTPNSNAQSNRSENAHSGPVADEPARAKRFDDKKTRKCEKRQQHISQKLDAIAARGSKQLNVFHSIANRVKTFYVDKGYSVKGYAAKVAELDTLYDQSLVALTATQNASDSWNCILNDPVAWLEHFKDTKRSETETIMAYKAKVRELILLVKQAEGQAS